jgi:two-component system C4-dicarboxylate transport response regulator DctD
MAESRPRRARFDPAHHDDMRPRVLLAEDDLEMRRLVAERLDKNGYDVVEVGNGIELLRMLEDHLCRARGQSFDVVVSDVRMHGASGLCGLQLVHDMDPTLPVVLMTGYPDDVRDTASRLGAVSLLHKPFPVKRLVDVLQAVAPTW